MEMAKTRVLFDVWLWCLVAYLSCHVTLIETRMEETDRYKSLPSMESPAPPKHELGKCFHMSREQCPAHGQKCARVDPASVFCCDVDSFQLKEALQLFVTANTTNLHVLNANIDELDVSQSTFRRLVSIAVTDGSIRNIIGQFPKHSSVACLNMSNNNLNSATLPSIQLPFAHLNNLSILDLSANNLTEIPLKLQHKGKTYLDLSGNNYISCRRFEKAMADSSFLQQLLHYNQTQCALIFNFNWFVDVHVMPIDNLRVWSELHQHCRNIKPLNINCTCVSERLHVWDGEVTNLIAVDCSQRNLKELPTDLPPNTIQLNVSHNNIASLQAVAEDPSYKQLRTLIVDYNDIDDIGELEGTKFIEEFRLFSIRHNKLKTIQTHVLSNRFDIRSVYGTFLIAGNFIHCDCNTVQIVKPWLLKHHANIPDSQSLQCQGNVGFVVELLQFQVCHA